MAQTETITATEGSVHETTSVTFNPGAPSATTSTLVASPGSVTADGVSTTTLTVTVEDAQGNLVPNAAVTLSGSGTGEQLRHHLRDHQCAGRVHDHARLDDGSDRDHHGDRRQRARDHLGDLQSGCAVGDDLDPGGSPDR